MADDEINVRGGPWDGLHLREQVVGRLEQVRAAIESDPKRSDLVDIVEQVLGEAAPMIADAHAYVRSVGETTLHTFARRAFLDDIAAGRAFSYGPDAPDSERKWVMRYVVVGRCPHEPRKRLSERIRLDEREQFLTLFSHDDSLADQYAPHCARCGTIHPTIASFMHILSEDYESLYTSLREATIDYEGVQGRGLLRRRRRAKRQLERAQEEIDAWEHSHQLNLISLRVKGSEQWWLKALDRLLRVDDYVERHKRPNKYMPWSIRDTYGGKAIVSDDRARQVVETRWRRMANASGGLVSLREDERDDRWSFENAQRRDGKITYQGVKQVITYASIPMEWQIQTRSMYTFDQGDHPTYKESLMIKRSEFERISGIPYWDVFRSIASSLDIKYNEEEIRHYERLVC